jgi:hypothetical protein
MCYVLCYPFLAGGLSSVVSIIQYLLQCWFPQVVSLRYYSLYGPFLKSLPIFVRISFVQTQILPYLYPAQPMLWMQVMLVPICNVQDGAGKWAIVKTCFLGTSVIRGIASPDILLSTSRHLVAMQQWSGAQCVFALMEF